MYIKTSKDHLVRLKNEHTNGEIIEFSDNNVAHVTQEIGEQLIDNYDHMEEK